MYRLAKHVKDTRERDKLLNNGYRFALMDGDKMIAVNRYEYPLEHEKRLRPTLILQIVPIESLTKVIKK